MEKRLVDTILELKTLCRFEEEICGECDLSLPEVRCVSALRPAEEISAGDLALRLELSPSRASRVITAARQKGLLSENLDPRDRRAVSITLTVDGERMRGLIEKKKDECERRLLKGLRAAQVQDVRQGLGMLLAAMKAPEPVASGR
jgi:DNA-binding MarR family transcriptional regulator